MTEQRGGTKRSSWLTFRRRLLLVRLLLKLDLPSECVDPVRSLGPAGV
jgi:hypothetical protein